MAGKRVREKAREPVEAIVVVHDLGGEPEEWEALLSEARERSAREMRPLVIVERPRHTEDEQARIDRRLADAAAALIREYISTMEKKIAVGAALPAEREKYRDWYRENIVET